MIAKVFRILRNFPETVLIILMVLVLADMLLSVVSRYVVGQAVYWCEELGTFGLVWITMIGASVAVRTNSHFVMPTFVESLHPLIVLIFSLVQKTLIIGFSVLLMVTGLQITKLSSVMISPALGVNMAVLNISMVIGGALIFIYSILQVVNLIQSYNVSPGTID